jgi:hypothetical protein
MRGLLDVNVLIALLDAAHQQHGAARAWLEANIKYGWASCPITQNGCVRIMSRPAYPGAGPPAGIAARLREATETEWHRFWPDTLSLLAPRVLDWRHALGSRQLADLYLLALAVRHDGRLVTLDRGVPVHAVPGAEPHHLVSVLD